LPKLLLTILAGHTIRPNLYLIANKDRVMNNQAPHSSIPDMPSLLGWGGLIPFGLAALGTHSGVDALVLYGFIGGTTYGAIILSFLGAVHWGLAMQDDRSPYWYVWSISPALMGFASLMIFNANLQLLALIPLFVLTWLVDRQAASRGLVPAWYMQLRTILTIGAVTSLAAMLLA
jgi:hypothetical protein